MVGLGTFPWHFPSPATPCLIPQRGKLIGVAQEVRYQIPAASERETPYRGAKTPVSSLAAFPLFPLLIAGYRFKAAPDSTWRN